MIDMKPAVPVRKAIDLSEWGLFTNYPESVETRVYSALKADIHEAMHQSFEDMPVTFDLVAFDEGPQFTIGVPALGDACHFSVLVADLIADPVSLIGDGDIQHAEYTGEIVAALRALADSIERHQLPKELPDDLVWTEVTPVNIDYGEAQTEYEAVPLRK